jgi:isocitrate dehydrogenase
VTVRKSLSLFANVRPCISYHPFVETDHPGMDLVIIRENEEDLYGGIEYRQSQDVMASLKIISRPGCERIVRYAFEYAKANERKKVTCMTKDNIMKMSDGLFHKVFDEIGEEYPQIEQDHMIIDIGAAKVASDPSRFDVIVLPNLYGDIVSDIAAEVTGSVGLGGSSNIGADFGMFEAVHGSAPDISGMGIANPSGLILGAVMMLVHIGQGDVASKIHNAWLKTIEDGIHTGEDVRAGVSHQKVGTEDFTKAVIERLGQEPKVLDERKYANGSGAMVMPPLKPVVQETIERVGVDLNLTWKYS